jgi:hypothetical protein
MREPEASHAVIGIQCSDEIRISGKRWKLI